MSTLDQFDIYVTLLLLDHTEVFCQKAGFGFRKFTFVESGRWEDVGRADGVRGGQGQGQAPAHGHH